MKVRYRVLQEISPEGVWETVGTIIDWEADPPHLRLRGVVQHTVGGPIWRKIMDCVEECHLTLETYHDAFGEYERYYRLLPEIHTIERETAAEIRQFLQDTYVYGPVLATTPA